MGDLSSRPRNSQLGSSNVLARLCNIKRVFNQGRVKPCQGHVIMHFSWVNRYPNPVTPSQYHVVPGQGLIVFDVLLNQGCVMSNQGLVISVEKSP